MYDNKLFGVLILKRTIEEDFVDSSILAGLLVFSPFKVDFMKEVMGDDFKDLKFTDKLETSNFRVLNKSLESKPSIDKMAAELGIRIDKEIP